ncbi:Rrf2 family transcriptional regulator [Paenibacillus sp. N1-5-1-14]|uniref:RrF2 family transcriptional regulator n=1 Tax=Paenibacillus radicibacter TaxID=2972488 RepID=UPI00215980F0|nr:Rrf2 family transcriptional regulator [Paenibacillus radicibacter]MCR8644802.1 Rrf2 family transcriptional regulator [Paenibacillus radicibacter]
MRLTYYTDYSLRVLMYLAVLEEGQKSSIGDIARSYGISENHLIKVVHELGKLGLIATSRGRGGGIKLAVDPKSVRIGDIVRQTEKDFDLVECFDVLTNTCKLSSSCKLKHLLASALQVYLNKLNEYTLADIVEDPSTIQILLQE